MRRTGILFDLDGTLLNTLQDLTDATNAALRRFGCPERSIGEIRSFVGNGARNQIRLSLPGRDDDPDLDAVLAWYKAYYAEHCQIKTAPYPGIAELLERLKGEWPMAIVSNKPDNAVKQTKGIVTKIPQAISHANHAAGVGVQLTLAEMMPKVRSRLFSAPKSLSSMNFQAEA